MCGSPSAPVNDTKSSEEHHMARRDADDGDMDRDMEQIVARLRAERPQLDGLGLDRVRTGAISRARATGGRAATRRRLLVAGLTVGLLAAGTGGVIAAGGASHTSANAASAQYGVGGKGVGGSKTHKPATIPYRIHLQIPHHQTLRRVTVKLNETVVLVLHGRRASSSVTLSLPCGKGTITIVAVTTSGLSITEVRHLRPCRPAKEPSTE
jgi:hypothetical protein